VTDQDQDERDATLGHVPHDIRMDRPTDPLIQPECARLLDRLCEEWACNGEQLPRQTVLKEVLRRAVHRTQWCRGDHE